MEDEALRTIAVFFGGFRQDMVEPPGGVFKSWIEGLGAVNESIMNLWSGNGDSLQRRWTSAEAAVRRIHDLTAKVHVLGYSMGCHLAVKFALDLFAAGTGNVSFGDVYLIAPDPKFIRNELDDKDGPESSAFEEAKTLWGTRDAPGEAFARTLQALPSQLGSVVNLVYSEADSVAQWKDNVARLRIECGDPHQFHWTEAWIGDVTDGRVHCKLIPPDASDEFWVHDQLFANTRLLPPL